jgi:hypothetical protein
MAEQNGRPAVRSDRNRRFAGFAVPVGLLLEGKYWPTEGGSPYWRLSVFAVLVVAVVGRRGRRNVAVLGWIVLGVLLYFPGLPTDHRWGGADGPAL